jgi:ADP-ribosylglycohydrolase
MAIALTRVLLAHGAVNPDALAAEFCRVYLAEPWRGYGSGMHELLPALGEPGAWRRLAPSLFEGQGSAGNGAAMRVAPLGAFLADDLDQVVAQAALSAEVTHAHPEGVAGAIAVAVAAALAYRHRNLDPADFIQACLEHVPPGSVRRGLMRARDLGSVKVAFAARDLGNGSRVMAEDTVPFVVWSAAQNLHDYPTALWETVIARGDIDTTCAMVGGIVAAGGVPPPKEWLELREALPGL